MGAPSARIRPQSNARCGRSKSRIGERTALREVQAMKITAPPRLLVTGFGAFPGAPENPTEALVRALAEEPPARFGAGALRAAVLPTDYRRSWPALRRLYGAFAPDLVVHFGL